MHSDTARQIDDLLRQIDDIQKRVARLEKMVEPKARTISADRTGRLQWCPCGREQCRAPACPTFQPDPLGR